VAELEKSETLDIAIERIVKMELGVVLKYSPEFLGMFEHFYDDSVFENVSTHYINLAYQYEANIVDGLPTDQHSEYKWFSVKELMLSKQVHNYVKDYFRG
jgi:colanic acid biosynthesis protein WcaH